MPDADMFLPYSGIKNRLWNKDIELIDGIFRTVYTHVAWDSLLAGACKNTPYTSKTQLATVLGSLAFSSGFGTSKETCAICPDFYAQSLDCEIMRVQEHVKLSALAAVVALPWLGKDVLIPLTSSVLIDVDHYLWHAVTNRTLSLREAIQYFGQADPPKRSKARLLHHPLVLGIMLLIALRTHSRVLMLILAGLLFHVGLDVVHATQMKSLKQSLTKEANCTCPECGKDCEALQLHTNYFSHNVFDHYNPGHFVVLCPTCHERAHS